MSCHIFAGLDASLATLDVGLVKLEAVQNSRLARADRRQRRSVVMLLGDVTMTADVIAVVISDVIHDVAVTAH